MVSVRQCPLQPSCQVQAHCAETMEVLRLQCWPFPVVAVELYLMGFVTVWTSWCTRVDEAGGGGEGYILRPPSYCL